MQQIPFRLASKQHPLIIVSASINDSGPHDLLLDTGNGAPFPVLLTSLFVNKLNIENEAPANSAKASLQRLEIRRFRIGNLLFKNLQAGVFGSLDAIGKQIGLEIAGNIGYHFFKNWCVIIDYQKNLLSIATDQMPLPNGQPFERGANGAFILLKVTVNGAGPFRFLLDTGASSSVISPALAEKLKLQGAAIDALSVLGSQGAQMVTLDCLSAAGEIRHGVEAAIIDIFAYTSMAAGVQIDGILGYSFLRNYAIIIDYPRQKLALINCEKTARLSQAGVAVVD